jgi:cytolysin (calcineurin-like family phosphatase)
MHKPDEWIASTEERDRFKAMIQQYEVSAVFAGHHHSRSGPYDRNSFFGTVPLFLSGSASQRHYLIAEVDRNAGRLNVMLVSQNDWQNGVVLARPRLPASKQVQ